MLVIRLVHLIGDGTTDGAKATMRQATRPTAGTGYRHTEAGQILPLAAIMMISFIGFAALAIDVSAAYLAERTQRVVADAAALAGGQDLQLIGTRAAPGAAERTRARGHAMDVLVSQLNATSTPSGASCFNSAGCALPGTPYVVSIQTPSPSCVDCDPRRAIQVSIRQPAFGLTFARIFGEDDWNVTATSVAGTVFAPQYGIVTLRPPSPRNNNTDANEKDLFITGGSKVVVGQADVFTNTNLVCSGSGSELILDVAQGYDVNYFGLQPAWLSGSGRCMNPPPGVHTTSPLDVPTGYATIPMRTASTPVYATAAAGRDPDPANCLNEQLKVPAEYKELKSNPNLPINDPTQVIVECYRPGVYQGVLEARDNASGPPVVALLEPGVYFFDAGVRVQSSLIGGYDPGTPGVALVFKEANVTNGNVPGQFITTNSDSLVALNFGSAYCPGPPGTVCPTGRSWASAAQGPQGPVQTSTRQPVLLTVMVERDPGCVVGVEAPSAADCNDNKNKTLQLTGGGNIFLAGVQFAPSDNAVLTGNAGQRADIGAFWAWTIEFKGGTEFSLSNSNAQTMGVLRLDPACSPTVTVCNP